MLSQSYNIFSITNRLVLNDFNRNFCVRFRDRNVITIFPSSQSMTHRSISAWNKEPDDVILPSDCV